MSQIENFYRQGDLLFKRVSKLPDDAIHLQTDVVAEGELTGHKHRLQGNAQLYKFEEERFVAVKGRAKLVHDEHKTITLEDGVYVLVREREFTPFANMGFVEEKLDIVEAPKQIPLENLRERQVSD